MGKMRSSKYDADYQVRNFQLENHSIPAYLPPGSYRLHDTNYYGRPKGKQRRLVATFVLDIKLPQLTVYAKIIYLLMVVISGALCTVEDFVIMSQCAHNKAIHLAAEGTVSVTDTSQIQNITIYGYTDYLNNKFKIALYAKETQRYLCFNDNWRLVGMRELRETCYFKEALVHGYFVFSSLVDEKQRVGFTRRGKPVGPKKSLNDACYMFNKIDAEEFFRHHRLPEKMVNISSSSGSSNSRKPPRNNKNNRHKSNNQNQKLQQQQEHHGHNNNNNNNNNVILNNSSTSLSSTNKKQLAINRQQQQQQQQRQHQVRHHHNDPSLLLRRQQHEMKQKRRKQQKQQHQQQQHEQQQQRVTASPTKRLAATATATTVAVTSPTATKVSATTLSSKRKGRRRKGKAKLKAQQQQQQQLLATAATSPYTDDSLYSSSSSSFSSTGFEDPDNSSSSSSLDPWSTWSTIDSFSSSSTTTTSDDSISSSSNYDAWATFISQQELEASSSSASSATTPEMMSANETELLQYEPELVEDADFVTDSDSEAAASTTYETKATPAIAATAATTTSTTTGSQLVLEQTPLAKSNASNASNANASAATPTATTTAETEAAQTSSSSSSSGNPQENPGINEVKPRTFLWTTRATAMQQPAPGSTSATSWTSSTPPQHVAPSLFSVDKNINSNLQNNTLTEASPTTATTGATSYGVTMTAATTLRKPQRMFTRRLMATPFHRLAYVRNAGGDVDIDNLDNISVYPVEYDGDLDGNGGGSGGNSSDGGFTGFLATSTTSKLTEPIRIGMKKIRQKATLSGLGHRRNA